MTRDETVALFLECEAKRIAARAAALAAGKSRNEAVDDGHAAAKKLWNDWANGLIAEREAMDAKNWRACANADFGSCVFFNKDAVKEEKETEAKAAQEENAAKAHIDSKPIYVDAASARFDGFVFPGRVSFTSAVFSVPARFDGANFSGDARFECAAFSGSASSNARHSQARPCWITPAFPATPSSTARNFRAALHSTKPFCRATSRLTAPNSGVTPRSMAQPSPRMPTSPGRSFREQPCSPRPLSRVTRGSKAPNSRATPSSTRPPSRMAPSAARNSPRRPVLQSRLLGLRLVRRRNILRRR